MVEHAEKQDEIELAQCGRVEVVDIEMLVLYPRAQAFVRSQELIHSELVPGEAINGEHPIGAATFALE